MAGWLEKFKLNPFAIQFSNARDPEEFLNKLEILKNSQGISKEEFDLQNSNWGYVDDASYIDFLPIFETKRSRVSKYREMSLYPEVKEAIENHVNDAIVDNGDGKTIELDCKVDLPTNIKKRIDAAFSYYINNILNFSDKGDEYFKKWLIEGEIYAEIITNEEGDNIIGIKVLPSFTCAPIYIKGILKGYVQRKDIAILKNFEDRTVDFEINQIAFANYGDHGENEFDIRGFLESSIKTYNQLKSLEDSIVIYRLCIDGESRVRTNESWKYMKDVKVGDVVYSNKNGILIPTNVTNVWNNGFKNTVKIRSLHNEIICTEDHPILVRDNKSLEMSYVEAGKLKVKRHQLVNSYFKDDNFIKTKIPTIIGEKWAKLNSNKFILDFKVEKESKCEMMRSLFEETGYDIGRIRQFLYVKGKALPYDVALKICNKFKIDTNNLIELNKGQIYSERLNLPEYVTEEFAKLFGFLIGDGTVHKNRITFAEGEYEEVNVYYKNLLKKFFGKCERTKSKNRRYTSYYTSSTIGVKIFEELGYIHGAKNKRIPEWVFNSSKKIKQAFIEGLSDADGCERYTNKGTWFSVISLANKKLVEDIKEVWSSIGLSSGKITKRNSKKHFCLERLIHSSESWDVCLTKLPLKEFENVISIENFGEREVFDLEVENEEHNFIANNITVHNCRGPERRVWNIYTGRMPKGKAEEFLKQTMKKYKTKNLYDPNTGAIDSTQNIQTMSHDIWFAKDDQGNGTTVDTIGGAMNLGEIRDLDWFREKLFKALKLPTSRWNVEQKQQPYSSGKMGEIAREEINYARFIEKLQRKFKPFIMNPFLTLLRMRGIPDEYLKRENFDIKFTKSNLFKEYKEIELREARLGTLSSIAGYIISRDNMNQPEGLFAKEFVLKNYFKMTNEEYEENERLKQKELAEAEENIMKYPPINPYDLNNNGVQDGQDGSLGQQN